MRLVAYTRRSTDRQTASPETQEREIRDYCRREGHELVRVYHEVAITGKTEVERRTVLPELMAAVRDRKARDFDGIVVWHTNRLFRRTAEWHRNIEVLDKHECKLLSVMDPVRRQTAADRLLSNIMADVSAHESEQLGERVYAGQMTRFLKGQWMGGRVPMGLTWVKDADGGRFDLTDRADDVVTVFRTYLDSNCCIGETMRRLNATGVLSPTGGLWSRTTVTSTIQQPLYRRQIRYANQVTDAAGIVPEVVPAKLLAQIDAQVIPRGGKSVHRRKDARGYSGLLFCGRCGAPMVAGGAHYSHMHYRSWQCSSRKYHGACDSQMISEVYLDVLIGAIVGELLRALKADVLNARPKQPRARRRNTDREVNALQEARERYADAYALKIIKTREELMRKVAAIDEQIAALKADKPQRSQVDARALARAIDEIADTWGEVPEEEKRGLLMQIGARFTIETTGDSKRRRHRVEMSCAVVDGTIGASGAPAGTRWGIRAIDVFR